MQGESFMKKKFIDIVKMQEFETHLRNEERSEATIGKYLHDVKCLLIILAQAKCANRT